MVSPPPPPTSPHRPLHSLHEPTPAALLLIFAIVNITPRPSPCSSSLCTVAGIYSHTSSSLHAPKPAALLVIFAIVNITPRPSPCSSSLCTVADIYSHTSSSLHAPKPAALLVIFAIVNITPRPPLAVHHSSPWMTFIHIRHHRGPLPCISIPTNSYLTYRNIIHGVTPEVFSSPGRESKHGRSCFPSPTVSPCLTKPSKQSLLPSTHSSPNIYQKPMSAYSLIRLDPPPLTQATVGGSPFGPFISVARGHSRE